MTRLESLKNRVAARIAAARTVSLPTRKPRIKLTEDEIRDIRISRLRARAAKHGELVAVWDDLSTRIDAATAARRREHLIRLVVDAALVIGVAAVVLVLG